MRGPVEPLEEAVPDELWPPGEGNDGLLYGRHPSSGDASGKQRTFFKFDFYCGGEMRLTSDAGRRRALFDTARDICRVAVPTGDARARRREDSASHMAPQPPLLWKGKYNKGRTTGCCGAPCCRAS